MARASGERGFDLHLHTTHSPDGEMTPTDLVRTAVAKGLGGVALTDHNSTRGIREAREAAAGFPGFLVVPGIEVSTKGGHIIGLGIDAPVASGLEVPETVERIRALGGLPVASHPYRRFTGIGEDCIRSARFGAVEVLNGRSPSRKNLRACRLALELRLGLSAGSDGHRTSEVGRCYVVPESDPGGVDGLLEQIRGKRVRTWGRSAGLMEVARTLTKISTGLVRRRGKRI
ncbi:MAG: PHP domain-containing protein [Euryarchaeota archaeon]|nr:PHP domain-containing protein [Euryarchaeota archaeon]